MDDSRYQLVYMQIRYNQKSKKLEVLKIDSYNMDTFAQTAAVAYAKHELAWKIQFRKSIIFTSNPAWSHSNVYSFAVVIKKEVPRLRKMFYSYGFSFDLSERRGQFKRNIIELIDFLCSNNRALPNDNACRLFLEDLRWSGTPVCPKCGSVNPNHYKLAVKGEFKGLYKCKDCRERFTVTVGTMFEGSHVPLRKWFIAIYIFTAHKKGISSIQLGKDLGITQKSAWFVLSRLRNNFQAKTDLKFDGITQADESFLGGKNKNRHKSKRIAEAQGRSVKDKTPVFGMVNNDQVYTQVIPDTKASTLKPIIEKLVVKGSILVSDEWNGYRGLDKDFNHVILNHQKDEFVNDNGFHNNSIEGFWSLLKRGIYGIYHQVSPKHLNKYCDEFAFRYNTRDISDDKKFSISLLRAENRLTYKELIGK